MARLCRDCLLDQASSPTPCIACGGIRFIEHPERDSLAIAHIDCDAFYASIEKRDNPDIRNRPVIIGGGKRGVVSTCCYIARTFGVRSAMPMFKALAACPQAVIIKPDMDKYVRIGRDIRKRMFDLTPMVEPLSIDEAFLDMTGTARVHGMPPAFTLAKFQNRIENDIGITVSVGLSHNKFLAKIASDLDKPNGFSLIGRDETLDFLSTKPIGIIFGVGKISQQRFANDGVRTILDMRNMGLAEASRRYGGEGERLYRLAHGEDVRSVRVEREAKSISAETTFESDTGDMLALEPVLWRLAERVADRMRKAELCGTSITLKMKTHDFKIRTRARQIAPTQLAVTLYQNALDLLQREPRALKFRLLGIGVNSFEPQGNADRGDLLDTRSVKEAKAAKAIGALRDKFGTDAVRRGPSLPRRT